MRSVTRSDEHDYTARASIRNAALRLFAERGPDAVTIREVAADAGVSPALVLHHFGSKAGLRDEVDAHAAGAFDAVFDQFSQDPASVADPEATRSVAEAFSAAFPPDSPLPSYLRRLLLSGDPAGSALFRRWFTDTVGLLESMVAAGAARPTDDPTVRAAFLLANDLAIILLRPQLAELLETDPLSAAGMDRWAGEAVSIYTHGVLIAQEEQP